MDLKELQEGEKFERVPCILKEIQKGERCFFLTLADKAFQRKAYVMANLYDLPQLAAMKGRAIEVSGILEPQLEGLDLNRPNMKVKVIELLPEESKEAEEVGNGIERQLLETYCTKIKEYKASVGKTNLSYRMILEQYFKSKNLSVMMSMPATHTRQGCPFGGMLQATLAVTDMAANLANRYLQCTNGIYSFNDKRSFDWDLLITGGLLHLAGNFLYFEEEKPHRKKVDGVEAGFSSCRERFILQLIQEGEIDISNEDIAALFGVMARLNEQQTGVNKCRQEAIFLQAAYNTFLEIDRFDAEIAEVLKKRAEGKVLTAYDFSDSLGCYISKTEIDRKTELLGLDMGGDGNAK